VKEWIVCRVGIGRVEVGVLVQWASEESVGEAEEGLLLYKLLWVFAEGSLSLTGIGPPSDLTEVCPPSDLTEVCLGRTVTNKSCGCRPTGACFGCSLILTSTLNLYSVRLSDGRRADRHKTKSCD
jgi:hypothetical protein